MTDWKPSSVEHLLERIERQAQKIQMDVKLIETHTVIAKRLHTRARYIEQIAALVRKRLDADF